MSPIPSLGGAGADRHMVKGGGTWSWLPEGGSAVFAMACPPVHKEPSERWTWDLGTQRSQHLTEMAEVNYQWRLKLSTRAKIREGLCLFVTIGFLSFSEVRKSLEQIRIFTEHKDVLTREIQDENDMLKDQLQRLISLQGWTFLPDTTYK